MPNQYRRLELRWKVNEMLHALNDEAEQRGMSLQQFISYVMRAYYLARQGDTTLMDELLPTGSRARLAAPMAAPPGPAGSAPPAKQAPRSAPAEPAPAPPPKEPTPADDAVGAWMGLMAFEDEGE